MSNVLQLVTKSGRQTIDRTDDAEFVLREVRLEVYKHHPKELAKELGLSVSTINAFKSGRTVWPRPRTLFAILDAVGYEVRIVRKGGG